MPRFVSNKFQGQDRRSTLNQSGSLLHISSRLISTDALNSTRQGSQARWRKFNLAFPGSLLICMSSASIIANSGSEVRWQTIPLTSRKISNVVASNAIWQIRLRKGSCSFRLRQPAEESRHSSSWTTNVDKKREACSLPLRMLIRSSSAKYCTSDRSVDTRPDAISLGETRERS